MSQRISLSSAWLTGTKGEESSWFFRFGWIVEAFNVSTLRRKYGMIGEKYYSNRLAGRAR